MCLRLAVKYQKRIAETNIICYKHLKAVDYDQNKKPVLKTPYQNQYVQIGRTYTSPIKIINLVQYLFNREKTTYQITEALHSFKYLKNCKEDSYSVRVIHFMNTYDQVIVKCVIPKGSEYYVGKFGRSICYASDKLVYLEVLSIY